MPRHLWSNGEYLAEYNLELGVVRHERLEL
jgi:hypothetical protein